MNENLKTYIYRLRDPITNKIRYVGKTTSPKRRYYQHCSIQANKNEKSHRSSWLISLLDKNRKPIFEIIDTCLYKNWEEIEKYWIDHHKKIGCNLCNHSYGGSGILGHKRSEETKRKISKNNAKATKINKTVYRFNKEGKFIDSFHNPTKASEKTNICITKILRSCRGYYTVSGGFIWSYDREDKRVAVKNMDKAKRVVCLDLEDNFIKKYKSISQAAKELNLHTTNISNCCKNKPHCKSAGGFKWKYLKDYENE